MRRRLLYLLFLLAGCGRSVESCRQDADAAQSAMYRLLEEVHSKEDLRAALPKLRRLYLELAEVMVAAERAYDIGEWVPPSGSSEASLRLRSELIRIYRLNKGQDLMEEAQEDALVFLEQALSESRRSRWR